MIYRLGSLMGNTACGLPIGGLRVEMSGADCPGCKRGPGRPSRGTRHDFSVRLTPSEWAAWQDKARREGVKMAELLRRAVDLYPGDEG